MGQGHGAIATSKEIKCGDCGFPMRLGSSLLARSGKTYTCIRCGSIHGADPDGNPAGIPGNKDTRMWRIKAHDAFDQLWKSGMMRRPQAYAWLRKVMDLKGHEAHIGTFDIEQCRRLEAICLKYPLN